MAIYDNFPWTNVHELNLAWIIEQVKAGNLKIDGFEEALEQFEEDYDTLSALAAAFTIAGSNISTTKNFSAASLSGPLTGNVTGDLTGNADTATHATSADSATTAISATNAVNAQEATKALHLYAYSVTGDDLNKALPTYTEPEIPSIRTVYRISYPSNAPTGLNTSDVICVTDFLTKTSGDGGVTWTYKFLQTLYNDTNNYIYHRTCSIYQGTKTFSAWSTLDSVSHATTADSATTATTADSATSATTAATATNATNASHATTSGYLTTYPKIGNSDANYVTCPLNSVGFEYCPASASNLPDHMSRGAVIIVSKITIGSVGSEQTLISQWALNPTTNWGAADSKYVAYRSGYCSGIDKDPVDDTFTWTTWLTLLSHE